MPVILHNHDAKTLDIRSSRSRDGAGTRDECVKLRREEIVSFATTNDCHADLKELSICRLVHLPTEGPGNEIPAVDRLNAAEVRSVRALASWGRQ